MATTHLPADTEAFAPAARRLADDIANEIRLANGDPTWLLDIATSAISAQQIIRRAVQQSIVEFRHARREAS